MIFLSIPLIVIRFSGLHSHSAFIRSSERLEQAPHQEIIPCELPTPVQWPIYAGFWRRQSKPNGTRALKYVIKLRIFWTIRKERYLLQVDTRFEYLMHVMYLLFAISLRLQAHYRELLLERRREILHESEGKDFRITPYINYAFIYY